MSEELLTFEVLDRGADVVVSISGELDFGTTAEFQSVLQPLARGGRPLVLDLAGLAFCDSTGLGALVRLHKLTEESGGRLSLARLRPRIESTIKLTMLHRLLHLLPEVPADHSGPVIRD
ncbi:STAS domain-containing protein [Kribbella sp. CA-293567]|uniref:STAS domain-containing protein n=1 Tax=Kribbella sp. CA-293567 TaxID=3002436 RepID=UPI0022DD77BF|nr:STAS domain-containing protein [Kribbella sp. CA-293567]WBQ08220.1 STAS domain-containing protein [Kribbella sp. CA-293567]